jgi:serine/threonine-protein kinase RsbW
MKSEIASEIEVCVIEALNNCVEHAYHLDPHHEVDLKVNLSSDEIVLEICDAGVSADPDVMNASHSEVLETESFDLETMPERGRGLAIIQKVMDGYEYKPGTECNCLRMLKRTGTA